MTTISARTILRSRNASAPDKVLSTLLLRYPRFIHAEVMTHRAFSRNAASSRAIPVQRIIDDILADTAMPLHWGKNQKGMQAREEHDASVLMPDSFDPEHTHAYHRETVWKDARDEAIRVARAFDAAGYHKQIVNRLLEPFMHITVLVSATEWANFLELRDHEDAEPHIAMLAREVRDCLDDESTIQELHPGEWHLPFVSFYDDPTSPDLPALLERRDVYGEFEIENAIALSVARCASTSYKTVDGFDMSLDRAIALHDKLVGARPLHASPCEHVAQVDLLSGHRQKWLHPEQHANFIGFRQYRHMLNTEVSP